MIRIESSSFHFCYSGHSWRNLWWYKIQLMHDTNLLEDQPVAWTPTPDVIERSRLMEFMRQVGVSTWDELYDFSIGDVEKFTEEVLRFLHINFDPPYEKLLDLADGIEFPKWFRAETDSNNSSPITGHHSGTAGLNITTMCLDRWQTDEMREQPALIWEGEEGGSLTLTYSDLLREVTNCADKLCDLDIKQGDAVGIHLPMIPETVVSLLAINRIGAIAVPVFSGYGIDAITSRMEAVGAKAIFTADGFPRRGKPFDMLTVAARAVANVATIKSVIVVERNSHISKGEPARLDHIEARENRREEARRYEHLRNDLFGGRKVAIWGLGRDTISSCGLTDPARTSAEDPLIILYTSGTTGKPKGIAHTHASFPIKAAQDMAFGTDVGRGTRISWYTDIGWMMGPWLIYGALINGATICIYDGAPDYPTPDRMWKFCAKHEVEILGISPTLVRALASHEESVSGPQASKGSTEPVHNSGSTEHFPPNRKDAKEETRKMPFQRHDLSSLRAFASTGEPWNPAPWWWLFEKVGNSKLPIINYSGGTEISGGILMGNMLLPQKPCSFPAPCPGMDVDILDEKGDPVAPAQVGELVIKQPWIGMARGFWQERERYLETYWSRFKNIWVHGDWARRDQDGDYFILGRSDDILKVAGKRVGPAEVESLLVAHAAVAEAAVIGVPDEKKGTAMVAFAVLTGAQASLLELDDGESSKTVALRVELKSLVATDMGKPLAPSRIHFVGALPKTRNAKVMRRVIRSAYLGEDPGDLSALENPGAVEEIQALIER
jgi:acetyl-CoA synthetase